MSLKELDNVRNAVQPLMGSFAAPWCVAGGWALDLFLGRVTRTHADLELAIFRQDQALLRAQLADWRLQKIVDGRTVDWHEGESLSLPVHEIHGTSRDAPPRKIEFLLNERNDDAWVFRRNAMIALAINRAIVRSKGGLPILAPEIVLLFKAKSPRPKDELDFRDVAPAMNGASRRWLREALALCHAGYQWIKQLA